MKMKPKQEDEEIEKKFLDDSIDLIESHLDLFKDEDEDSVIHFLVNSHFDKNIPTEWKTPLLQSTTIEMFKILFHKEIPKHFPDSLHRLIKSSFKLRSLACCERKEDNILENMEEFKINRMLSRGMSEKKKYEIEIISKAISKMCKERDITECVLLGSGKGHLGHVLSFEYGLNVIGIDCNANVLEKSEKWNKKISKKLTKKSLSKQTEMKKKFEVINCRIEEDISSDDFLKLIGTDKFCLVGLHACGTLSITMTKLLPKLLKKCEKVVFANVPCCYHKLRVKDFPICDYLKRKKFTFSTSGFHLATQSIEKWWGDNVDLINKDGEEIEYFHCRGAEYHCKRNSYRCALEVFLIDNVEKKEKARKKPFVVGKIRKRHLKSFGNYVFQAVQKIRLNKDNYKVNDECCSKLKKKEDFIKEMNEFYEKFSPNKETDSIDSVEKYWMLRACFSPIFENLIILDRLMYLKENGVDARVKILFDGRISPRNKLIFFF